MVSPDPQRPWRIHFFQRDSAVGRGEAVPALDFLSSIPVKVAAEIHAVLDAVAAAPPPSFSGGGKWEAMHGDMSGYFEIRVQGGGMNHRLFACWNVTPPTLGDRALSALTVSPSLRGLPPTQRTIGESGATAMSFGSCGGCSSSRRVPAWRWSDLQVEGAGESDQCRQPGVWRFRRKEPPNGLRAYVGTPCEFSFGQVQLFPPSIECANH
jgi:hypothetical protein